MSDDMIFADNLKRLAKEKGYLAVDIARYLGVSKQSISAWTHGNKLPRMDKVDKLCELFQCRRSDLLEEYSEEQAIQNELFVQRKLLFDKSEKCSAEQLKQLQALIDAMVGDD